MFEFDAGKLVIIGIVALIVIGPKELPRVMRQVGQAVAKIRRLGAEFQAQFMEAMREADLEELKLEAAKISEAAKLDVGMDPLAGIRAELTKNIEERAENDAAAALPNHTDPLAEALREDPEAAMKALEAREEGKGRDLPAEPVASLPAISAVETAPHEAALVPEPLHKRA